MDQQMNLGLRRTGRVQLLDDAPPRQRRALLIEPEDKGQDVALTDWLPCTTPPVRSGDYDVKVIDEPEVQRMTFTAQTGMWTVDGWPFPRAFGKGRQWRGLAQDPSAK